MIIPGRITLWIAGAAAAALLLSAMAVSAGAGLWLLAAAAAIDALMIAAVLLEGVSLRRHDIRITPLFPPRGEVGRELRIIWRIENRGPRAVHVVLEQPGSGGQDAGGPAGLPEIRPARFSWRLPPLQAVSADMALTPNERGILRIAPPVLTITGSTMIASCRKAAAAPPPITIFPSIAPIRRYEALRRNRALSQIGMHRRRMVGAGREFEQLRDYLPDDDFRDINWKASAHHRKLITNVYQMERSQDVLLCIDAARMMAMPVAGGTGLDVAIDAAILLAHVVARQADRVGLMVFRDQLETFIKPAGSSKAVSRIINALVEIEPRNLYPSYSVLAEAIRLRQNRRAMIFIFTDVNDPQLATNLSDVVGTIRTRHLVTVISLRDPLLNLTAEGAPNSRSEVFQVLAARQLVSQRDSHKQTIKLAGAGLLESDAGQLSIAVINRYLSIKARQLV